MNIIGEIKRLESSQNKLSKEILSASSTLCELGVSLEKVKMKEKEEFESIFIEQIMYSNELKMYSDALKSIESNIQKKSLIGQQDIVSLFNDIVNKQKIKSACDAAKKNPIYIQYKQAIWTAIHPDEEMPLDENISIVKSSDNFICPLTRTELIEPMKNQSCGHVYSKIAIFNYLKSGNISCPIAGCLSRISKKSIINDRIMAEKLSSRKKRNDNNPQNDNIEDL